MSTTATPLIQIYAPDGTLGEVPYERLHDALQAGGKMAVHMTAPDGTEGYIPADKTPEAVKAGGKIIPFNVAGPAPEKEGFWKAAGNTLSNLIHPTALNPYPGMGIEEKQAAAQASADADAARKAAGYSSAYRAVAPIGQSVGADVGGMEQAAKAGDTAGVLGHAVGSAAPVVAGAGISAALGESAKPVTAASRLSEQIAHSREMDAAAGRPTLVEPNAATPQVAARTGILQKINRAQIPEEKLDIAPPAAKFNPALNNTPREVLTYAANKGIDLTPAQATRAPLQNLIQAVGERALWGSDVLAEGIDKNAAKFMNSVSDFARRADPKALGLSEESAGEAIKQSAQTAKTVAHDNATAGYQNIDYLMNEQVAPKPITDKWVELRESLPMGAEESIINQVPRNMKAQVADLLSSNGIKAPISFEQGIKLRSFFRELGDTDGLPNSQQAVFRQMAKATDSAMESTAQKLGSAEEWRDANAGWKDYTQKYGDLQSPLTRILRQSDPARITRDLLNRGSAKDVEILNGEGMSGATDAMKRQVIEEIARNKFNVGRDGIGGYSNSFIQTLFGPDAAKELYLNAELGRRFNWQQNPSGTSNVMIGERQITHPEPSKLGLLKAAATTSMPRPAVSYLPKGNLSLADLMSSGGKQ